MSIELDAPNVGALEKEYLNKTIDSGFISTFGPFVSEFEGRFAKYVGAKKAVSTQSGTAALHIALYELGIGPGDEVIVPVSTFIATVNPVIYLSATPVFVDIDVKTWNISPHQIEKNITKKTKAIIPVHVYGNPCAMDEIMTIAKKNKLCVIEDATESLGATYKGKHSGTFGDFGCFSFNGNKTVTTGGGGMVTSDDDRRIEHIKFLVNQARDEHSQRGYFHPEIGFNYRMTNLEASLGLAQMERLKGFLKQKQTFAHIYQQELKEVPYIRFQAEYPGAASAWWLVVIMFERAIDMTNLQGRLKTKGIPSRRAFLPLVEFPPYQAYKKSAYTNAYKIYERGLCLPSSTLNSADDIVRVCDALKEILL